MDIIYSFECKAAILQGEYCSQWVGRHAVNTAYSWQTQKLNPVPLLPPTCEESGCGGRCFSLTRYNTTLFVSTTRPQLLKELLKCNNWEVFFFFLTPREHAVAFIFSMLVHPGILETITSLKQSMAREPNHNIIGNISFGVRCKTVVRNPSQI